MEDLKREIRELNVLKALKGMAIGQRFVASDINAHGMTMQGFTDTWYGNGLVSKVGTEDTWYQIDEDTMKRGERNVYRFNGKDKYGKDIYDCYEFQRRHLNNKIRNYEEEIAYLNTKIDFIKEAL